MAAKPIAVLVVEDEPLVRMDIVSDLEDHGLYVLEAANAREAIAILEAQPVVDVLFTDVDMPGGLDGLELAKIVKQRFPGIQVIVTSGHREFSEADLPENCNFFPKPYASPKIVRAILNLAANDPA
ncbi:response regulator [Devosia sp. MC521]|uniref:response regulator n=1 Tax=Devosia sp. MC521 TaxID=2759954 RepID=UPI0015FD02C0|nr:response regulator [Devosia sp. MC521]MBJ6986076.1 response regulator [Devosia sp. MC521]QMW61446.1 response regulator [Devosia sp. MC521]